MKKPAHIAVVPSPHFLILISGMLDGHSLACQGNACALRLVPASSPSSSTQESIFRGYLAYMVLTTSTWSIQYGFLKGPWSLDHSLEHPMKLWEDTSDLAFHRLVDIRHGLDLHAIPDVQIASAEWSSLVKLSYATFLKGKKGFSMPFFVFNATRQQ
jgi:hypothetical protein